MGRPGCAGRWYSTSTRCAPCRCWSCWYGRISPCRWSPASSLPPFWAALVALSAHIAAYVAEIVRAGIKSIRPGQTRAALALGMSRVAGGPQGRAAAGAGAHAAGVRLHPVDHHQGHRDRRRHCRAGIHEAVADPGRRRASGRSRSFTVAMVVYFIILFPVTRRGGHASTSRSRIWAGHEPRLVRGRGATPARWRDGAHADGAARRAHDADRRAGRHRAGAACVCRASRVLCGAPAPASSNCSATFR